MRNFKNAALIFLLGFLFLAGPANLLRAQETITNLKTVKSEQLSNEQIKLLMQKALNSGMSPDQIEALARARGMSQAEIDKIKTRAEILNTIKSTGDKNSGVSHRVIPSQEIKYPTSASKRLSEKKRKTGPQVFGYSLFTNPDLTFDPGINIATPKSYQLGPGDILNIDVWGDSQKSYQELVSPEGKIIISKVGPIFVSGLTISQATKKIKNYLTKIYAGLNKGNTFLELSLGGIRSIRVNILGEVNLPGTYNLSSLASVFNAMYAAGGPADDGSLRDVKIIRNNKTIAVLDFYDFLLNGVLKGNMRLQDQDIVFVSPYKDRVQIKGQVKRNMFFDMKPGETLQNLVHYAGGFTGKAYTQRIKIIRKTPLEKKILVVKANQMDTTKLYDGDVIQVDSVLNRFQNRVQIYGAVMRPGAYAIDTALDLKQLIQDANGLKMDAYKKRITVYRLTDDLTRKTIALNLNNLMHSQLIFKLKREDSVYIPSLSDMKQRSTVLISGQVAQPGTYPFSENMRLQDLIIRAGGMLESASMAYIDVARRIVDTLPSQEINELSKTYKLNIGKNLYLSDSVKNFKLSPYDQVFIRKSPVYNPQQMVSVEGEVNYPGKYSLKKRDERISDLLKSAGGLTQQAYLKGASLIRYKKNQILHQKAIQTITTSNDATKNKIITNNSAFNVIGVDLQKILTAPGCMADLKLQPGDSLQILKKSQTVTISGAVYRPNVIPYEDSLSLHQYISMAGGFTKDAVRKNIYIIYANGSVKKTTNFLFIKGYPKVEPGAEIIVPKKQKRPRVGLSSAVGVSSAIASLALVIITIVKTLKP